MEVTIQGMMRGLKIKGLCTLKSVTVIGEVTT